MQLPVVLDVDPEGIRLALLCGRVDPTAEDDRLRDSNVFLVPGLCFLRDRIVDAAAQDVGRLLAAKGLAKTDRVIVMCRSGDRSARAVEKLAEAGFTRVYNQHEGFEGDLSADGRRSVNGWRNAGLPWTFKPDKAKFYLRG